MIELVQGDILKAPADGLVNTVNCVGVMGRGIALQFKKAFPEVFKAYKAACDREELKPGVVLVHDLGRFEPPHVVFSFPTKRHWKGKSRLGDIDAGLPALVAEVQALGLGSVAVPPLGCGLGGLPWEVVRPRIEAAFEALPDVRVLLYEPAGAPSAEAMAEKRPDMTVGRAALLALMRRYLSAVMDPDVTLLEIHKLMYFMQVAGEPLRLQFSKGPYGPYGENLRHVLTKIEGHFILGYADAADRPLKRIEAKADAVAEAEEFLADHQSTRERFDRVAELIEGFETAYGLELLATVHWVAVHEGADADEKAVRQTHAWNERKQKFEPAHIRAALRHLISRGWIQPAA